jgi:hypothetical protein
MDEQSQHLLLTRWCGLCNEYLREYLNACLPVLKDPSAISPNTGFVLNTLGLSCHTTSESALLLVGFGRLWDADMLVRSVLEGTAKYMFLAPKDPTEREGRCREYWHVLPEFDRLKRHERVKQFAADIGKQGRATEAFRELQMSDEEAAQLRAQYPRRDRHTLAQKWSFNEIIKALTGEQADLAGLLGHAYGMASNTLHQDSDGVAMIRDRVRRSPERRELVEVAHAAREVGDILTFGMVRAMVTLRLANKDLTAVREHERDQKPFHTELHNAIEAWWAVERRHTGSVTATPHL